MLSSRQVYIAWQVFRGLGAITFGLVLARISPPQYHADGLSGYAVLMLVAYVAAACTLVGAIRSLHRARGGSA